jgi:pyrroline-5-carboxylate reductase
MALDERKLAFIGAGHITNVIVDNLVKAEKVYTHRLIASDPDKNKLQQLYDRYEIVMANDNPDAVNKGDFIFINVLIPINAYEHLGESIPVVRALPNPPSQIGKGIAALAFNPHVTEKQKVDVFALFTSLGKYVVIDEDNINAVMALSSPAATYLFFQSLIDAGIRAGIDQKTATKVVYQTIVGAMEVWNQRQVSPHELLSEASTPGGISAESIFTLEQYAFRAALNDAINSAVVKADAFAEAVRKT